MSFIKRGDGKILTVVDGDNLDEQSKKSARDLSEKINQEQVKENSKKLKG